MMDLKIGKIYKSKKRDHVHRTGTYHPFVFLGDRDELYFEGAMLTSKNNQTYKKNHFINNS